MTIDMTVGQFIERAKGYRDYERMCRMKDERHETIEQSVIDCNHLGNAAKMREALRGLLEIVCIDCNSSYKVDGKCVKCPRMVAAEAALSARPRNCDVGTAEEQAERFHSFCESNKQCGDVYSCECCQLNSIEDCELAWAQMPYEGGVAK